MLSTRFIPFIFVFFIISCGDPGVVLVKNGSSSYSIVLPEDSDSLTHRAAGELSYYIEEISSAELAIVNENSSENLIELAVNGNFHSEEIEISIDESNIQIVAGSSGSLQGAVYLFLENYLNCRFYTPGYEKIPEAKTIRLKPDNFHYLPPIKTRTVHSRLFYDNPDFAAKRRVTLESFPGYVPGAGVHTFHRFLPADKYFDEHPEYYAFRDGRRVTTQLCLTNPEVLEITIDVVDSLLGEFPDRNVISVSQDDNTLYCTCENCSKVDEEEGSPSGTMIRFVNEVAKKFPDKTISTLAYQYTRTAPAITKPEENVLITLCSIECDRSGAIEEKCVDFANDLKEWSALTDNVRIWDYTTQFTNFLAPFPNIHTLKPNINLFADNNAQWVFEQHSHQPSELFELRSYLTANLLWDPSVDDDSVMNDFIDGYYGPAGKYVENYVDTIHAEIQSTDFFLFLYGDPSQAFDSFLRPDLLELYDSWYDSARAVVAGDSEMIKRVNMASLSVDYAILEAYRKGLSRTFSLASSENGTNENLMERIKRFENTCAENNITLMNEMRYGVDEYLSFYNKTIARSTKPNKARGAKVTLLTNPKKYANEDPAVITDGAYGGANFYSNWLGFEGNHGEMVIDMGERTAFSEVSSAFLKVVNHIVFFPLEVTYSYSSDGKNFKKLGTVKNQYPLEPGTKINDIQYFTLEFLPVRARYIKLEAKSMLKAPEWHHGAGNPAWIFIDELEVR